jgi:hypothetical protein
VPIGVWAVFEEKPGSSGNSMSTTAVEFRSANWDGQRSLREARLLIEIKLGEILQGRGASTKDQIGHAFRPINKMRRPHFPASIATAGPRRQH